MISANAETRPLFNDGKPAMLSAPGNQSGIEQAALFEIADQGRRRAIDVCGGTRQARHHLRVMVPELAGRADVNEADAALDQSAGNQASFCKILAGGIVQPILAFGRGRLPGQVERLGRSHLHAGGELVVADPGFEVGFSGMAV